jgi:YbgC/YbaW family acyl-CoA thioester hydrolase
MSKIFTRTFRVRWSELDAIGTVSPANYLRYLLETAWDWGIAIGWDADYSQNPDVLWLIREAEIRFLQPLRHNDEFDLTIWMVYWQKVRGRRCFELTRKGSGDVIAQGTQQVVYMDAKTGRPINLPEAEIIKFRLDNPRVFPFERFPKIKTVESSFTMQRRVEWMDLDAYEHVNNVVYVNYAEEAGVQDFASKGWSPAKLAEAGLMVAARCIQIQYLSVATWGETLQISTHLLGTNRTGGSRYIGMTHADGSPVADCILDWELVDRKSGEVCQLPEGIC